MKTTRMFKLVGLVAIVCALFLTSTMKAQGEPNFITNEEVVDNLVVSKVIYRMDGALYRHMKYNFTYDDQHRMTSKEALKWDGVREEWTPYFKMTYAYTESQITLEYARWNERSQVYNEEVKKSVYELNEANMPVACTTTNSNGDGTGVKVN